MALQPREKKLAILVGVLAAGMGLVLGVGGIGKALSSRRMQRDALAQNVQQMQFKIAKASLALEKFTEWERRSLPRDRELARTLYQNRLAATMAAAQLKNVQVEPGRNTQLRDVYTKFPYVVRAQGKLGDLAQWLAAFYRADDLQQFRDLSLQPSTVGELQLTATIEALSLPAADRTDRLTTSTDGRIDEARAVAATQLIAARNLFAPYVPPTPPRPPVVDVAPPPPPPAFDESKYTYLTSILFVGEEPQAWLNIRPTKQTLRLRAGDGIRVGQFTGTLVRIGDAEIEVEQAGERRIVRLGQTLAPTNSAASDDS